MGTCFHPGQRLPREPDRPESKLGRQQLSKKWTHARTGIKIAPKANYAVVPLIVSNFGTIKRQFQETREGNRALRADFLPY